jgi:D-3-phosphoglycerate dehydrogenase
LKLLIADTLPKDHVDHLREVVDDVEYNPDLTSDTLMNHISGVNILVVRSTKVSGPVLAKADALELIVRSGAGTENIDMEAASRRGIFVTNCQDKNSAAVAELTIGLLLAVDRRIPEQTQALKEGSWNKKEFAKADGLKGKTLGVIGTGSIGKEVIKRAKCFDMPVVAWSRSLTEEEARQLGVTRAVTIDELLDRCDIVSVHVAFNHDTKHLLSGERLARLKPGTILLNTSRGAVVDNAALATALRQYRIRAGLDVYENEPAEGEERFQSELSNVPNWVGTHHVGASTDQAQRATADETVRIIEAYVNTGKVENCVDIAKETPAVYELMVRHYDKIGVLTRILNDLRESRINVREVHNVIFEGAKAAVATIQLDTYPPPNVLDKISARRDEIIQLRIVKI